MFYRATWELPKSSQHFTGPAPDHQNVFAIADDGCRDQFHRAVTAAEATS